MIAATYTLLTLQARRLDLVKLLSQRWRRRRHLVQEFWCCRFLVASLSFGEEAWAKILVAARKEKFLIDFGLSPLAIRSRPVPGPVAGPW